MTRGSPTKRIYEPDFLQAAKDRDNIVERKRPQQGRALFRGLFCYPSSTTNSTPSDARLGRPASSPGVQHGGAAAVSRSERGYDGGREVGAAEQCDKGIGLQTEIQLPDASQGTFQIDQPDVMEAVENTESNLSDEPSKLGVVKRTYRTKRPEARGDKPESRRTKEDLALQFQASMLANNAERQKEIDNFICPFTKGIANQLSSFS